MVYIKHGHCSGIKGYTPTYSSWQSMIKRCSDKKNASYSYYGGRGISICKEWFDFENFFNDMGHRPENKTLDRIDNNGDYCKSNCRWATQEEQNQNTSSNVINYKQALDISRMLLKKNNHKDIASKTGVSESIVRTISAAGHWKNAMRCAEKELGIKHKVRSCKLIGFDNAVESVILYWSGLSHKKISLIYGCNRKTIGNIVNGKTHKGAIDAANNRIKNTY